MKKPSKRFGVRIITQGAMIAALYVVLTYLSSLFGLASGVIQVRLSEMLTILPYFTPAAIPGLFVGCILANMLTGCLPWDIVFGSLATLIGAVGTWLLRKKWKYLATIPPVLANAIIVPFVLQRVYGVQDTYWFLLLTVGIGEIIACCILGGVLLGVLDRRRQVFGKDAVLKDSKKDPEDKDTKTLSE
ncbi:MAG: QueT transporter family protein [Clostridia bacterium]|nr:QueT transporter family protein [Clostridia bacterium]